MEAITLPKFHRRFHEKAYPYRSMYRGIALGENRKAKVSGLRVWPAGRRDRDRRRLPAEKTQAAGDGE